MTRILIVLTIAFLAISASAQEIKKVKITDLEKTIAESNTPLIVNFWATWCKPCLEELPYFMEEAKKHNVSGESAYSFQLLLVSLDMEEAYPAGIKKTIAKRKITAPVEWLDETNADHFCPKIDPKWSGAIPASLFINNKTGYRKFFEEQLSHENLKAEIRLLLAAQ